MFALFAPILLVVELPEGVASASPGSLDPTFRSGNVIMAGDSGATGVAVLDNGDIAVSGGDSNAFQVQLFSPSGDPVWNRQPFASGRALAVATSHDSRVIAAGWVANASCVTGETPAVAVYDGYGNLIGSATLPCLSNGGQFNGVAIDYSASYAGLVVAAGFVVDASGANETLVARFNSSGSSLDTTFNTTGYNYLAIGGVGSVANGVVTEPTGDVIVAGDSFDGANQKFLTVAAFKSTGVLDSGFGRGGFERSSTPGSSGKGVVVGLGPANGAIFLAGDLSDTAPVVEEFSSAGVSGYSAGQQEGSRAQFTSITYQPYGDLVTAAGMSGTGASQVMLLEQFRGSDGTTNQNFGDSGVVTMALDGPASLAAVASDDDGKVLGAGQASTPNATSSIGLIRVMGPTVSVQPPPLYLTSLTGVHPVTFVATLDEPVGAGAWFCVDGGQFNTPEPTQCIGGFPQGIRTTIISVRPNVLLGASTLRQVTLSMGSRLGAAVSPSAPVATMTIEPVPNYPGYRMAATDGGVFTFGGAPFAGSEGGQSLNAPVVGTASTLDGTGYWLVASDGGVFTFGNAPFYGSMGGLRLNAPVVGMAEDPATGGYWLVASDGGVFSFNAPFLGSRGDKPLNAPIVGVAATSDGGGYWLVARDGGVFTFGDAAFLGSKGGQALNAPVVGMATYPSVAPYPQGYWLVAKDGGVFTFGTAPFYGSMGGQRLNAPVVGIAENPDTGGYWLVASDGGTFSFNAPFNGSEGGKPLNAPVVGISR